ncbi:MAG: ATP-binding protein [Gaiellaceae bacterium]
MRRAPVVLAVAGLAIAAGAVSLIVARHDPAYSFAGTSVVGRTALLGGGFALVGAGLTFWFRRPATQFGLLLVVGGLAWFLLEWNSPGAQASLVFTAGLVFYAFCPAVIGHTVLAFPVGRLSSRLERTVVATAYVGAFLVLGLLPTLLFDPSRSPCGDGCARNLLLITARNATAAHLVRIGVWLGVVWAFALALVVVLRFVRISATARRSGWLVFSAGAVYLSLVGAMYAGSLRRGFLWNGELERRLWFGQAVALAGIALGVAWSRARAWRDRSAVTQLMVDLAQSPPPGGLRDALATIVGDPTLELAYPLEGSDRFVDIHGRPVVLSAGKQKTTLVGDGRPLAVAAHAPALLDDDQLVSEIAAAARLALENERLRAEEAARQEELRRSRARIVEAADTERRGLERDLHDGAQQHLAGLSVSLRLLRSRLVAGADPQLVAKLAAAEADLQGAMAGLRELAHGIFPGVLTDGGLGAAVAALAEDTNVPICIEHMPPDRFAPMVEAAAYLLVAETAAATAGDLAVRAGRHDTTLVLEIRARDVRPQLDRAEFEDRVGAAEGQLTLERSNHCVKIHAEFPCAS